MGYTSFQVQLDNCTFLKGSQIFEIEIYQATKGSLGALGFKNDQDRILDLVAIKVQKRIGDFEYIFYSPQYSTSIDSLRISIEFFKSVIVHYNEQNPLEYYFENKE